MRSRKYHRKRQQAAPPCRKVTGQVRRLGLEGDGVLQEDGKSVHVPFTLPGEEIEADASGSRGALVRILTESPDRQEAPCRHFGPAGGGCGGCALQHMKDPALALWKEQAIKETLSREGVAFGTIRPLISSPLRSRRRAGFHIRKTGKKIEAGFKARRSHRLVPMEDCLVLTEEVFAARDILSRLSAPLFRLNPAAWFTGFVTLCENGLDIDLAGGVAEDDLDLAAREDLAEMARQAGLARLTLNRVSLYSPAPPVIALAGVPVGIPSKGFLQATKAGEETLQKTVLEALAGAKNAADLFAGAGTFALALARAGAAVTAVDSEGEAIAALNRAHSNLPLSVETRDLFNRPLMPEELKTFDSVVLDPPRAGAEAQASQLARSGVERVASVSCNPKSFARDGRILETGGYRLEWVQPVDQFLFSPHIELVGCFRRDADG